MKNFLSIIFLAVTVLFTPTYLSAAVGDACNTAQNINVNRNINATVNYAGSWNGSPLVYRYYTFTAPSDGTITIQTSNASSNNYIEFQNNNCGYIDDDWGNPVNVGPHNVRAGRRYKIYIDADGTSPQNFNFRINFSPSSSSTVWVPNNTSTSATLEPSPYLNNSDDSEVLTIPGATRLQVTIRGQIEYANGCVYDYVTIASNSGTRKFCGNINRTYTINGDSVTLNFHSDSSVIGSGVTVTISSLDSIPPIADAGPNQTVTFGSPLTLDGSGSNDPDGNIVSYIWQENGRQIAAGMNPTVDLPLGMHTITLTVTDNQGKSATDTVIITINTPPINAINDTYSTNMNIPLSANLLTNDLGIGLRVISNTNPSNGSVSIVNNGGFTYTPNLGYIGNDSFTYTVSGLGGADTATVNINITNTINVQTGAQPFTLINPPNTRNILGNYAILGNTLECITNNIGTEARPFNGTCQTGTGFNNNNYMTKYIDIDNNNSTWNSSSSNFTLPDTYDNRENGQGIAWAGLFWQGNINNFQGRPANRQRRSSLDANGNIVFTNILQTGPIALNQTNGSSILMKVNDANYIPVQANTFFINNIYGTSGGTYAAYTDITLLLQNQNLAGGAHKITVANLTANEGREEATGNYAGWSIVVIYHEKGETVKARNISIYNGYSILGNGANIMTSNIQISGFKLPKVDDVNTPVEAQFSSFTGEGEFKYGSETVNGIADFDRMIMKRLLTDAGDTMPGATDPDNIFDAKLAGIDRDSGSNNDLTGNNNGIDIDNYDVSSIMTDYRTIDANISSVYIGLSTNHDYIAPSMVAFSAELYKPKVCYDFTIQQNNYNITDGNTSSIHTIGGGNLSINIALRSMEGDFDFENSQLALRLSPTNGITFTDAFYAPNTVNTLIPATIIPPLSIVRQNIAIGENVGISGGTIKRRQRYFSEFNYNLTSAAYNGDFEIDLNTSINFGSGAVPIVASTENNTLSRCPQSLVYNPMRGTYNVERHNSRGRPSAKYPLYTQIVGKDFDFDLVAYSEHGGSTPYSNEIKLTNHTVDIELINAKPYNDLNATFVCANPNPKIIQNLDSSGRKSIFATFNNKKRVDLSNIDIRTDTALRNATFRMWYLVDTNGTTIEHNCPEPSVDLAQSNTCFQNIYDTKLKTQDITIVQPSRTKGFCSVETLGGAGCSNYTNLKTGKSGCYACLRDFFAKALCARDNFSIRPAAYRLNLVDSNETNGSQTGEVPLEKNEQESSTGTLAAGYQYKLKGTATSFIIGETALGYTRQFITPSSPALTSKLLNNNGTSCADTNNTDWGINFINGTIQGTISGTDVNLSSGDLVTHSNVGSYEYNILDINWTKIDQASYEFKTFPNVNDCLVGENKIVVGSTEMPGCNTASNLSDTQQGTYTNLHLYFMPYKFDINETNLTRLPGDAADYLYMNNFANNFYDANNLLLPNYSMSMEIEGRIQAYSKDDTRTTNYESVCLDQQGSPIAKPVELYLEKTLTPEDVNDSEGNPVAFQEFLQNDRFDIIQRNKVVDRDDGNSLTYEGNHTVIGATWFRDPSPMDVNADPNKYKGSAFLRLDTNIQKPLNSNNLGVNPVTISYKKLRASAPSAVSRAHMEQKHIPEGKKSLDRNITSYFSRIIPDMERYAGIAVGDIVNTTLLVDVYCNNIGVDCANDFNLRAGSKSATRAAGWYTARPFYDRDNDGLVDLNAIPAAQIVIAPNANVALPNAERNIITNGFVAGQGVTVFIHPQDPWHFSPGNGPLRDVGNGQNGDDFPEFFQIDAPVDAQATWSGVGDTGNTAGTTSSTTAPRMNW